MKNEKPETLLPRRLLLIFLSDEPPMFSGALGSPEFIYFSSSLAFTYGYVT